MQATDPSVVHHFGFADSVILELCMAQLKAAFKDVDVPDPSHV